MKKCIIIFLMHAHICGTPPSWKPGLEMVTRERIAQFVPGKKNPRIGLITNHTGKSLTRQRNIDLLLKRGINITIIFAPEHGLDGRILAEKTVVDGRDKKTHLPIVSLYKGGDKPALFDKEIMGSIDACMFDMQDSGMRHYTYLSTLYKLLEAAAYHNKPVIILDRPNPLGSIMEGPLVDKDLISFISIAPVPVRHGMTLGELALYINNNLLAQKATVKVVPMHNYKRDQGLDGIWLTSLSPNIKGLQSCYGYSFLGMLSEIKPFNMAVGTKDAFRCLLLPESLKISQNKWITLSLELNKYGIKSQAYRYFNIGKKQWFSGLFLRVDQINNVRAVKAVLTVTNFFKKEKINFAFKKFDKATGTSYLRKCIEGTMPYNILAQKTNVQLKQFYKKAAPVFLYKPAPKLILM